MPLRLTSLEWVLARLNLLPVPLLDAPLGPGIARVLVTACKLGLFDALSKGPLARDVLAERLHCHPEGLQLLLNVLVSAGYLRYRHGKYANTRMAKRWLTSDSAMNVAPYIVHSPDIVEIWDHLPEVVRENRQAMCIPYEQDTGSPEMREKLARHYAGLASLAMALGGEVVRHMPIPAGARQLLDVGGSHAAYSVLFCRRYRQLEATIVDIAPGIEAGKRTAKQTQMEERLHFVCGDIVQDDLRELLADYPAYDVALYFHIAHLLPPEVNAAVLAKVAQTLKSGGVLAFLDQVTDATHGSGVAALMVQFMALTVKTVGGTCYPFATVKCWLEAAGMEQVRQHRLLMPGATLITARKM